MILADEELAFLMGKGDTSVGKAMQKSMKAVRALDANADGQITRKEFMRLCDENVKFTAEL